MTNRIAIGLGALILAVLALNFVFGWGLDVFLGRKLLDGLNWLAFWR